MKKPFAIFAAVAFTSMSLIQAQEASSQGASAIPESQEPDESSEVLIIEEPSGAQPDVEAPVPAPSPTPPDFPTTPAEPTAGATESQTDTTTITISQTFTNAPDAIAVVGSVSSEEEKQKVEQALRQALPNKQVNNHLTVASQQIAEPSGAEKSQEESELDDAEDDVNEEEAGVDVEREFDLQEQNRSQDQP